MGGKLGGIECSDIGTHWAVMREGSEKGVITTKDGQGMATWRGPGIGRFTAPGKISFRGSLFFSTTSTSGGKLSFLNNVVGVFEYEMDEQGNCSAKTWEWKYAAAIGTSCHLTFVNYVFKCCLWRGFSQCTAGHKHKILRTIQDLSKLA